MPSQLPLFKTFLQFLLPKKSSLPSVKRLQNSNRSRSTTTSDQQLLSIWKELRMEWFPEHPQLDRYRVVWSKRTQKRTLASCNVEKQKVIVARELNYSSYYGWLRPLLYHELCHAYLGQSNLPNKNQARYHGKAFKALEQRHPQIKPFNHWIREGGWITAVRSDHAKRAYKKRAYA